MNIRKDYLLIAFAYAVVVTYVVFDDNPYITVFLIMMLFGYHIFAYSRLNKRFSIDKQTSVFKLQQRLDKSKKEQEESYKRFISLSRSFGSGLLMVDEEGKIKLANKDIFTYFGKDFNNQDYQSLTGIRPLYKFVNQAYLLETSIRKQVKYNEKVFDLISTPLFEDNLFQGTLILVHDITLINQAEKYQKQFTADVSHELRTPLSAIKGFSEILSRDKDISEKERTEFIELIRTESTRMEVILNDLMIISKMDRLDYELSFRNIDIAQIIKECTGVLKNQIENKGLELSINVVNQELQLDKVKFTQVVMNIIKNAINYTDTGFINISGKIDKNSYILEISDSGIGINTENFENIFKRFYRVDKARSRDTGGSGLGLSISKNVIKKHNGEIHVESMINKGTTFTIKLPIKR